MNADFAHYYRQFRADNPHYTAQAAYNSARSFVHFRARLAESVKQYKKRSKAAKKAWKTRRAKAAR